MPADRSYPTRSYLFAGSESTATKPPPTTDAVDITRATRIVPATSRNASAVAEVEADAVLRVELENGFILWSRADDLLQERGKPLSQRDGETTWSLDFTPRPGQPARGGERGLLKLAVKVLDVFGINLRQKAASKLGEALEDRKLGRPPGLYRCAVSKAVEGEPPLQPVEAVVQRADALRVQSKAGVVTAPR